MTRMAAHHDDKNNKTAAPQLPPHPEEEEEEEEDNHHVPNRSSRLPFSIRVTQSVICIAAAAACCMLSLCLALFVCLWVLLGYTNTPEVHAACFGLWDLMLVSMLTPCLVPIVYCALGSCLLLAWRPFYGAMALVMGVACLHMALVAGETPGCVEALRLSTPPVPWLLYAAFLKSALFLSATASAFFVGGVPSPPSPAHGAV